MEPTTIFAGSSLSWTRSVPSDYDSADGYSCEYHIYNSKKRYSLSAECALSGTTLTVTAATSVTAGWAPGEYGWTLFALKSGERVAIQTGVITVRPDVTSTAFDHRSHVKKTLDAIEAVIENRASKDQMSYSIGGRSLSRTPLPDLIVLRDKYREEYRRELDAAKVAAGQSSGNIIRVRFS